MDSKEFKDFRKKLKKTQLQMAQLLGTSLKAVHSYEQGWRSVPTHVERQMFFMISRMSENKKGQKPCWVMKKCPSSRKKQCPAWEFRAGKFCWVINGTICDGAVQKDWKEKMKICRSCDVITSLIAKPVKKAAVKKPAAKKTAKLSATDTVLRIIKRSRKGVNIDTVKEKTGFQGQKLYNTLYVLKKQGKVNNPSKGIYVKV